MDSIGYIIKINRTLNKHSQEQLAGLLFKDQGYVSRLESGKEDADLNTLLKIAEIYDSKVLKWCALGIAIEQALPVLH